MSRRKHKISKPATPDVLEAEADDAAGAAEDFAGAAPARPPRAAARAVEPELDDEEEGLDAAEDAAEDEETGAAERGSFVDSLRERPGSAWAVQIHLAVLAALGLVPLLKLGYERVTNTTLEHWMTGSTIVALVAAGLVLGFLLVELFIRGFGLTTLLDIAAREYKLYYVSPTAYVLGAAFLFMVGYVFFFDFFQLTQGSSFGTQPPTLRDVFQFMGTLFLFLLPLWTMRLLAEEQRQGTIELLFTSPVRDGEIVTGKYLGALSVMMDTIALTLFYPLVLFSLGNPDPGLIVSGYIGILLFGAGVLAIGVFGSSVTENQVIAAVISFGIDLGLILFNAAASLPNFVQSEQLRQVLQSLNIFEHLDNITRGVIDSYSLVFFLSLIAVWLFVATRVIETRRWR